MAAAVKPAREARRGDQDGAPGGAAPRSQGVRAPGGGPPKPTSENGARVARSQGQPKGVSQTPGASRRSIPLIWGNGQRDTGLPGPFKNTGDDARLECAAPSLRG